MRIEEYYPSTVASLDEFNKISKSEQPEIDALEKNISSLYDENFIETMSIEGIKRFEKMLDIEPKEENIDLRRKEIKAVLMGDLPFTFNFLRESVKKFYDEYADVAVNYPKYTVVIKTKGFSKEHNYAFGIFLERILPANMLYYITKYEDVRSDILVKAHTGGYRYLNLPFGIQREKENVETLGFYGKVGYKNGDLKMIIGIPTEVV